MKAKMGRPPTVPPRPTRLAPLSVSTEEEEAIYKGAAALRVSIAQFLRDAAMAYSRQALDKLKREGK